MILDSLDSRVYTIHVITIQFGVLCVTSDAVTAQVKTLEFNLEAANVNSNIFYGRRAAYLATSLLKISCTLPITGLERDLGSLLKTHFLSNCNANPKIFELEGPPKQIPYG